MKYSNTALKELKKRYKNILIKCLIMNAIAFGCFATMGHAATLSGQEPISLSAGNAYTLNEDINISTDSDGILILSSTSSHDGNGHYDGTQLTINANNVSISTTASGNYGGLWTQTRSSFEELPDDASLIDITADNISIQAPNANGVVALSNSSINIKGNTAINAKYALLSRGYSNIIINKGNTSNTLQITGDISFDYSQKTSQSTIDSNIDLTFNGESSFWKGNIISNWDQKDESVLDKFIIQNGLNITLNEGASWTATKVQNTLPPEQLTVTNITVNKGTIHSENGNAHVKDMTVNGELTLNGAITTVKNGTITFKEGSSLITTLDASSSKFLGDGAVTGTINLTNLSAGEFAFMQDSVSVEGLTITNGLYNIEWADDSQTILKVTEKSTDEIAADTGASAEETTALLAMIDASETGSEKGQLVSSLISDALQSGDTQTAVDAAKKAAPTTAQVVQGVAKEAASTVARLASGRMDAVKGRAGGDALEGAGLWVQALYNHTKQEATSSSDGFKADSEGIALGVDKEVSDNLTLGLGYGYMQTEVDSYGREMDVDGHNFFLYGKYQPSQWYLSSVLSYNYSKYTEKKAPMGISLRSEYDVNSYGAQVMSGYNFKNGWTPEAGLRYLIVDADSYFDGMQRVRADKDDVLTAVAGVKYETNVKTDCMMLKPHARLALTYDLISDNSNANVSVLGGSSYSVEGNRLHRLGAEADLGVTATVDNMDITLEYNGAFRQDYTSQGGMLKLRIHF